jgi:hypothetical protein
MHARKRPRRSTKTSRAPDAPPPRRPSSAGDSAWPRAAEYAVAAGAWLFVVLISLFPIRNNDIWWHLAVGRELVRTHHFITRDPFMFSVVNAPWVPHSWLAGLFFYAVERAASFGGLVVLRAAIVGGIFAWVLRLLRRLGVSWTLAAPLFLVAALCAHSRFILRPHLFEYLFVVALLSFLIGTDERRGLRFYAIPVALQILWVNLHASFYLGFLIVGLFYAGEWLSAAMSKAIGSEGFRRGRPLEWRRGVLLLALLAVASLANPSPLQFLVQPLGGEQRELLRQYTLEWRTPFDPALRTAAFHPYYEILLAAAVLVFALSLRRLRITALLIVGTFAAMSLAAHRFRVEFSVAAVPLLLDQFRLSPVMGAWRRRAARSLVWRRVPYAAAVLVSLLLVFTARDRVAIDGAVSGRYPDDAFAFVVKNDVAKRSFHSVAFGSYLTWALYPDRQTFIDGRNIDASVYRDFLACQTNSAGFNRVIRKYDLDGFILPAPELSDGGMRNVHNFLIDSRSWSLAHIDRNGYVYVRNKAVSDAFLAENAYRFYHPLTFARARFSSAQVDSLATELARAVDSDSLYTRPLLDSARFYAALGNRASAAKALARVLSLDPGNAEARSMQRTLPPPAR